MSEAAFYFDIVGDRREVNLPSGRRAIFFKGLPDKKPVTDMRDVDYLRQRKEFFEVLPVSTSSGGVRFLPIEEAKKVIAERSRIAEQQADARAADAAAEIPASQPAETPTETPDAAPDAADTVPEGDAAPADETPADAPETSAPAAAPVVADAPPAEKPAAQAPVAAKKVTPAKPVKVQPAAKGKGKNAKGK